MICFYSKHWGCQEPARFDGKCLPHSMLYYWLIFGPGNTEDRIRDHDTVAGLGAPILEETLRGPLWGPRIQEALMTGLPEGKD